MTKPFSEIRRNDAAERLLYSWHDSDIKDELDADLDQALAAAYERGIKDARFEDKTAAEIRRATVGRIQAAIREAHISIEIGEETHHHYFADEIDAILSTEAE